MDYAMESLRLHEQWKGKIEVVATVPVSTKDDLSLAYTPGVAQPCLEIQKDLNKSYDLTRRHNLCAVITDGSAVLGLGDIGPEAGMPVMEGKCVLFKSFGGVDAIPLCVKTHDVDDFVHAVYLMSGSWGGINLEDIAAPRCFEIERKLKEICDIARTLGIFINRRKTQIVKLSHGFTFLKTRYTLTGTGRIIRKIPRDVVTRQRRKMKKLAVFAAEGKLSLKAFDGQYKGWRGDKRRYDASRTLMNMDNLHRRLRQWITRKRPTA